MLGEFEGQSCTNQDVRFQPASLTFWEVKKGLFGAGT